MAQLVAPAGRSRFDGAYRLGSFLIGFFVEFDLVPLAWHIPIPRISILPMLACIPFVIHRVVRRSNPLKTIFYCLLIFLFVVLHLAAGGTSLQFGNQNVDLAKTVSLAIYLIGGVGLYILLSRRSATGWFCWGLIFGALCSLVPFVMQANGMAAVAIKLGLAQAHSYRQFGDSAGLTRLSGIWGHPNEVGHALAITAPAAGYLFISRRTYVPFVLFVIIIGVCFYFTANRGGVIAALSAVVMVMFVREESGRAKRISILLAIGFLLLVAGALYVLPPPEFIYSRFFGDNAATENASGRLLTTLTGLGIAIVHPFGMAFRDWQAAMRQATGFSTPHNGFVSLAIALGMPLLLMYLGALVAVFLAGIRRPRKLSLDIFLMLIAVQASVSFMFEELADNDAFLILCGLILARVYSGIIDLPGGQARPARVRQRREDPEAAAVLQP